jgi:hypothetical protein
MPQKRKRNVASETFEHFPWFNSQEINQRATIVAISLAGYTADNAASREIRRKALQASVEFSYIDNGRELFDAACRKYPKEFQAMQDKFVQVLRNAFEVRFTNNETDVQLNSKE